MMASTAIACACAAASSSSSPSSPATEGGRALMLSSSQSNGFFGPRMTTPSGISQRGFACNLSAPSTRILAMANATPSSSRARNEPESSSSLHRKRTGFDADTDGTPWRREKDMVRPKEASVIKKGNNVNRYGRTGQASKGDANAGKKGAYPPSSFRNSPRVSNRFRDDEALGFRKASLHQHEEENEEKEEDLWVESRRNVDFYGDPRRVRGVPNADTFSNRVMVDPPVENRIPESVNQYELSSFRDSDAQFSNNSTIADETSDSFPSHITETRFDSFDISPLSIKALHSILRYERMTEVQEATFPVILQGKDVLAKARTGTGKTIAFLLPAIEAILKAPPERHGNPISILVVCPTRELAQQAATEAQVLLKFHKSFGAQVVYGGIPIQKEQTNLRNNPCQILVGTPGRLVDHIENTSGLSNQLKSVKLFILDEADHMLDMGFRQSLEKIMQVLPSRRQSLLFSATIPKEVHNIAKIALRDDYVFIDAVGEDNEDTHSKIKQQFMMVPLEKQLGIIYAILKDHMKSDPQYKVLVFCTTARVTAFMCSLFTNLGFNAREIHSRKAQNYRTRVSDEFRHSQGGIILFTSDVSARGVDYPNVTLVVQVGAPSDIQQYIHRLGRTGRAGKGGEGVLVLAPWENYFLQNFQKLPVTELMPPKLEPQNAQKILQTAAQVDSRCREAAYQAWLGYYRSLKGTTLDKVDLVRYANQFSASMGFKEPPALSKMLIGKMSLKGVPGIRCA